MILNTMQHQLTEIQLTELGNEGIIHLKDVDNDLFSRLANTPANEVEIQDLAQRLNKLIVKEGYSKVILPIGSPAFAFAFARWIGWSEGYETGVDAFQKRYKGVFLFAHSERESVEEKLPDGSVKKNMVFKHVRFLTL